MGKFLGLPEVLETDDEDENHLGLARPTDVPQTIHPLHRIVITMTSQSK